MNDFTVIAALDGIYLETLCHLISKPVGEPKPVKEKVDENAAVEQPPDFMLAGNLVETNEHWVQFEFMNDSGKNLVFWRDGLTLVHPDHSRFKIASTIAEMPKESLPHLAKAPSHNSPQIRAGAATTLGYHPFRNLNQ